MAKGTRYTNLNCKSRRRWRVNPAKATTDDDPVWTRGLAVWGRSGIWMNHIAHLFSTGPRHYSNVAAWYPALISPSRASYSPCWRPS